MKKTSDKLASSILAKTPDAIGLIKDIKELTVEDVVVIYAYAEAIVETVREPIVILDGSFCIKTANKAFFDMFKVEKEDTYNKAIFEIGNGQWNIPALKKLLVNILPKNSVFNDFEVTHKFEDLGERTMVLNARRIILEGHKTELILLAIEDITDKKKLEKRKDDFIAVASHELKTPMTSIKAFVQLLQKYHLKTKDQKSIYVLEKIMRQVDTVNNMMSSFLNVYSIQSGKTMMKKEHFLIDALVKEVVETFQYISEEHTITIEGKSHSKVFADKERISQVLTNLLTNAVKYSPGAKKIEVKIRESTKSVTVSVKDFGYGIAKDQQEKIFGRFYRSNAMKEKNIKGLGLGLYIVNEIIKAHKGKMWVDSTKGVGSTFHFNLPITI